MNIIYDTQSTINENINLRLNGLRPRSEASEELKNLNGKWIQICMRGFRPFSGSPGLRAGSGAADFLHVRHPIPQSRFASVGECKPRSRPGRAVGESGWGGGVPVCRVSRVRRLARGRAGCWRIRVGRRCSGQPGQPGQPGPEARPRPCGLLANQGGAAVSRSVGPAGVGGSPAAVRVVGESGRGVSRSAENPGRVSVCPAAGEGSRMPIRVSAGPKVEERTNAGPPSAGCPACWDSVGQSTEPRRRFAGKGCLLRVRALCRACCPQKMKGAPKGSLPHQKLTLKNYPLFGRPP